jgi:hypothetical protein
MWSSKVWLRLTKARFIGVSCAFFLISGRASALFVSRPKETASNQINCNSDVRAWLSNDRHAQVKWSDTLFKLFEWRVREGGNHESTYRFVIGDNRSWRLCRDTTGDDGNHFYIDHAFSPEIAWKLTPDWAVFFDPNKVSPPGHPFHEAGMQALQLLSMMQTGGLTLIAERRSTLNAISSSDNEWRAEFADVKGFVFELKGTWDINLHRGFVKSLHVYRQHELIDIWEFSGWKFMDSISAWAAMRIHHSSPSGVKRVIELGPIQPTNIDDFQALLRAPDFESVDFVRGDLHLRTTTDFRVTPAIERLQDSGVIIVTNQDELADFERLRRSQFRSMGWASSGLTVVGVLLLRVFKSS